MSAINIANKYLEIFFASKNFDELYSLFDAELDFKGPLYKFSSASDYIHSLKESPPIDVSYEVIEEFLNGNVVCILYKFHKGSNSTLMSQTFWLKNGRISKMRLIFNPEELR